MRLYIMLILCTTIDVIGRQNNTFVLISLSFLYFTMNFKARKEQNTHEFLSCNLNLEITHATTY
jgi:hypothetical protein